MTRLSAVWLAAITRRAPINLWKATARCPLVLAFGLLLSLTASLLAEGVDDSRPSRGELIAEDVIAERDLVAVRGTFQGVHGGAFAGIEATGRAVTADLMIVYRIESDRIAQHWLRFDAAGLIAQLTAPVVASA